METPRPTKGAAKPTKTDTDPSGEENFPRSDPTRRSAEEKMAEPSNVRPSNDPTPEKTPPTQEGGPVSDDESKGE